MEDAGSAVAGLEALAPGETTVVIAEKSVTIRPMRLRQVAPVTRALARIPTDAWDAVMAVDVLTLGPHVDHLADALAAAIDEPMDWVLELEPDDFVDLATRVVEVNADFFVRRLAPRLTTVTARLTAFGQILTPGSTPSSASSPTGTATPT